MFWRLREREEHVVILGPRTKDYIVIKYKDLPFIMRSEKREIIYYKIENGFLRLMCPGNTIECISTDIIAGFTITTEEVKDNDIK